MPELFEPLDLGPLGLTSRIVMAPMTRTRTSEGVLPTDGDLPNELTVEYYRQRASAGLIISETNDVDQSSHGYAHIPGIHSEAQKQAWRPVTDEVHRQGGAIFMQIWHVGRLAHSSLLPNGQAPVGVTSERAVGSEVYAHGPDGRLRFLAADTPRPLSTDEVSSMVCTFAKAAANAKDAGFDGVEIHGANGYLVDQFLNSALNTRNDRYGGSTKEDRSRFLMEIVDAVVTIYGPGRVGVRLSPFGSYGSMPSDPLAEETFLYVVEELGRRGAAYVHVLYELLPAGNTETATFETSHLSHRMLAHARDSFPGAIIWCGGFVSAESAQAALDTGLVDMIAFGRPYIANPDLVDRLQHGWPLAVASREVYYTRNGEVGYTDFPTYAEASAAERSL